MYLYFNPTIYYHKLIVLGTPAEEGGNGKSKLIAQGAFDDIDVAMMVHPAPLNEAFVTSMIAVDT